MSPRDGGRQYVDAHPAGDGAAAPDRRHGGDDTVEPDGALAIETEDLAKAFGETRAVDGIDLAVRAGTVYGVLGPNGAGKTTTIRMLATLARPDRGRARVLQEMANGRLITGGARAPEVHDVLDLCLSCRACASDCPAGVDMATYKAEVLHRTYRGGLRPAAHHALGWRPRWARRAAPPRPPGTSRARR